MLFSKKTIHNENSLVHCVLSTEPLNLDVVGAARISRQTSDRNDPLMRFYQKMQHWIGYWNGIIHRILNNLKYSRERFHKTQTALSLYIIFLILFAHQKLIPHGLNNIIINFIKSKWEIIKIVVYNCGLSELKT